MPRRTLLLVTVLYTAMAAAMTYPLAFAPVLPDTDDTYFNVWRLAWVAHQVVRDPAHLFDGNIFHPLTTTLAYSDAMLGLGVLATPLIHAGLHPVVVQNVLVLAAFVTAALGAFALCRHLTGSTAASLAGGVVFAFAPYRFAHLAHLELLWTAPMPLALLVLHRAVDGGRVGRSGWLLGALLALQAYCSLYYAAFLAIFVGLWTAVSLALTDAPTRRRLLRTVTLGALVAFVAAAPYGYVYYTARQELGGREAEEIRRYSATPADYLRVGNSNRLYPPGPPEEQEERSLFPGLTAVLLAIAGAIGRRDRSVVRYAALAVLAFDLSLGLNGIAYPILSSAIPVLDGLRAPARFHALFLVCLAVLAASGTSLLIARRSARGRHAIAALAVALATMEYWSAPVATRPPVLTPPAVYEWLRAQGDQPVVLELPIPEASRLWGSEPYFQYMSTFHWSRLVNGYSGYVPETYVRTLDALREFPTPESIARLRRLGVQYVIAHETQYDTPAAFIDLTHRLASSGEFDAPMTMPDPVDPAWVWRIRD